VRDVKRFGFVAPTPPIIARAHPAHTKMMHSIEVFRVLGVLAVRQPTYLKAQRLKGSQRAIFGAGGHHDGQARRRATVGSLSGKKRPEHFIYAGPRQQGILSPDGSRSGNRLRQGADTGRHRNIFQGDMVHARDGSLSSLVAGTAGTASWRCCLRNGVGGAGESIAVVRPALAHIGPAMFSSRVADVAGVPGNPNILYCGNSPRACGNRRMRHHLRVGLQRWGNASVGAVALSPDNPDIVYIGTGEGAPRNSISYGDGLYKSVDGGRTWKNVGLRDAQLFSRIVVDPKNPGIVFAAAMGHAFGPIRSAASTVPQTAARPGNKSSM